MTRKPLIAVLTSVLLLPASCACGIMADSMRAGRSLQMEASINGPLWVENLLWIGALALMLVWARQMGRLYSEKAADIPPEEKTS